MAIEIERKFLVKGNGWRNQAVGQVYRQGYMSTKDGITLRARVAGSKGYLTIKGPSVGNSRAEYEYEIPLADAEEMLNTLCGSRLIEKIRYRIYHGEFLWEVDEFAGDNLGLIMAEVELSYENQTVELPEWIGEEVSQDKRYTNSNLSKNPWKNWSSI
ncbi:CYTH domain-containing protein [Okeania sp.]|uniref:CYTH domain-containing protein n=1 Tax=Okeania sp. TaxID=3100323 RepID=UPI002B4B149F|nr:CYTH domain-containing protein [Okeania sp.]MEB3342826.1 CYTH domain-containing protein [Okeania sp.]